MATDTIWGKHINPRAFATSRQHEIDAEHGIFHDGYPNECDRGFYKMVLTDKSRGGLQHKVDIFMATMNKRKNFKVVDMSTETMPTFTSVTWMTVIKYTIGY